MWPVVECFGRADVCLGRLENDRFDETQVPRVPIELKTVGTFWKGGPAKALGAGKKPLAADLRALAKGSRRADPFGVVALLVTHNGPDDAPELAKYVDAGRRLGHEYDLTCSLDEPLCLPRPVSDVVTSAHQLVWVK